MTADPIPTPTPPRVLVLGSTSTIGRATVAALFARGHRVVCFVRPGSRHTLLDGAEIRFGDGTLTACKPISDADLGAYLADCIDNEQRRNRILPIGGPGGAITPRMQGEQLFAMLGRPPRFTQIPVALLDGIIAVLATLGRIVPALAAKAELARICRYYATEPMLVRDPVSGRYDADATPATGTCRRSHS